MTALALKAAFAEARGDWGHPGSQNDILEMLDRLEQDDRMRLAWRSWQRHTSGRRQFHRAIYAIIAVKLVADLCVIMLDERAGKRKAPSRAREGAKHLDAFCKIWTSEPNKLLDGFRQELAIIIENMDRYEKLYAQADSVRTLSRKRLSDSCLFQIMFLRNVLDEGTLAQPLYGFVAAVTAVAYELDDVTEESVRALWSRYKKRKFKATRTVRRASITNGAGHRSTTH